jgi:nicotinamide/nicotinate riboside kinase
MRDGLQDWDCPEAFDFVQMKRVLDHARETGELPTEFESKEETNELGPSRVPDEVVDAARKRLAGPLEGMKFIIVDGIMLYHEQSELTDEFDIRFFLRASYEVLKQRREARIGYATLEGFWQDPPGYFDDIVWPAYQRFHSYMFVDGDVSGNLRTDIVKKLDLQALEGDPGPQMEDVLIWASDIICHYATL